MKRLVLALSFAMIFGVFAANAQEKPATAKAPVKKEAAAPVKKDAKKKTAPKKKSTAATTSAKPSTPSKTATHASK